jgi:hypothetical protein
MQVSLPGWLHALCWQYFIPSAWNKQTAMEQRRSCRSRNTTTISNCCEKRASPSLFTGSSQRDQPRGECISPVACVRARAPARFRVFFSTKIFVPKRLRKNKRRGLGANISKRWLRERGPARMEILFLQASVCERRQYLAKIAFCLREQRRNFLSIGHPSGWF